MNCPKCNNLLEEGELRLHSGYSSRVVFSPISIKRTFAEKHLPGSIFDNKLFDKQIELIEKVTPSSKSFIDRCYYCERCKMIIIENMPRNE